MNYDLLNNDGINVKWSGNHVLLRRPTSLNSIRNVHFRNFIGDLLPFTSVNLPTLKCEVLMTSNGLSTKSITGDDNVYTPETVTYDEEKLNVLMSFSKEWTYDKSSESQLLTNIAECVEECNRRLNVIYPIKGYENRYGVSSDQKLIYSSDVELTPNFGGAYNYIEDGKLKLLSGDTAVEVASAPSTGLLDFCSNSAHDLHILTTRLNNNTYFGGKSGSTTLSTTQTTTSPSIVFFNDGLHSCAVVGHHVVVGSAIREMTGMEGEAIAAGFSDDGKFWLMTVATSAPNIIFRIYCDEWNHEIPLTPAPTILYQRTANSTDSFGILKHGGETFGVVSTGDALKYIYWQGSLVTLVTGADTEDPLITNPHTAPAIKNGSSYLMPAKSGSAEGYAEIDSFPDASSCWASGGYATSSDLLFDMSGPLKVLGSDKGIIQMDNWSGLWHGVNVQRTKKNALYCETAQYRMLSSDGMINSTSGGYATDPVGDMLKLDSLAIVDDQIQGEIMTSEMCYSDDKVVNLALRIYTDPFWFDIITPITYYTTTLYSIAHPDMVMTWNPINSHILHTVELLILMKWEYNDLAFKCLQFPNYDNVVFHINEEAKVEFKTAVMDNSVMWLDCTLTSDEDGDVDLETLKTLYGRLTVAIDWS